MGARTSNLEIDSYATYNSNIWTEEFYWELRTLVQCRIDRTPTFRNRGQPLRHVPWSGSVCTSWRLVCSAQLHPTTL